MDLPALRPNCLARLVAASPRPLALPIAVYPGAAMIGASVRELVTNPETQAAAQAALHARYRGPAVFSAMDLSAEAEAFGCEVRLSDTEVPTVLGRLVTTEEQARALGVPAPGDARTRVALEAVRLLRRLPDRPLVVAACIGPFSLAARLLGVSEALELTIEDPALVHALVEKAAFFLAAYARALREAGADALLMAEPAAGLLSPLGLAAFSSAYVRRILEAVEDGHFALVLHNCAARAVHLPAVLEAGTSLVHFGAPMDMAVAVERVGPGVVVCGNLDPTAVLLQSAPDGVRAAIGRLLEAVAGRPNFVLSSGCDVPPGTPLANLDVLYGASARPARLV